MGVTNHLLTGMILQVGTIGSTLLETNIFAPKNGWLEVGILLSYWGGLFSGAMLVSGRVYHPIGRIYRLYTSYSPCLLGNYTIPITLYKNH